MRQAKYNLGRLLSRTAAKMPALSDATRLRIWAGLAGGRKAKSLFGLRLRTLTKATGAYGQRTRDRPPRRLHIVYQTGQLRYYLLLAIRREGSSQFFHSHSLSNSQLFTANP